MINLEIYLNRNIFTSGNIFVCGGCYRHIMGRPENKLNSDSGEGNLLK